MQTHIRNWLTRWNASLLMICVGILLCVALIASSQWIWRQHLSRAASDTLMRAMNDDADQAKIVIVGIDDASLSNATGFGRLAEWDRGLYATLLDQLATAQARVVVFDILFTGKARNGDQAFAAALQRYPNTVMAIAQSDMAASFEEPTPELAAATRNVGHVNLSPDSDGVVRRIPLVLGSPQRETLGLAALRVWWNLPATSEVQINDDLARLPNGLTVPLANNAMMIKYAPKTSRFPTYSFRDVVAGKVEPAVFRDAIVIVGATATALSDQHPTPVSGAMDGVEIHANVIASLLRGSQLREQTPLSINIMSILISMGLVALALRHRPGWLLITIIAGLLVIPFIGMYMLLWHDVRIDMATPALTLGLVGIGCLAIQNAVQQKEYRQVLELFARRTPPSVITQLREQARNGTLKLGGERREVTVLFIDMRGFTTIAERLVPEDLMRIVNTYLDIIATTLIQHGGTLNQYAGDQAMAIFNAPVLQPDHAARAVRASRAALQAVNEFNCSAAAQALPARAHFGAGVNTGVGIVGNVGANQRYDYSVIGDVTNLAARLCGAAPADTVYIGADTLLEDLGDLREEIVPLGGLRLKGKEHPVEVYALHVATKEVGS